MRKAIFIICVGINLFSKAYAARPACPSGTTEDVDCWECGTNCTAYLSDGVLTISGSGDVYDYPGTVSGPWDAYKDSIHSVVIEGANETIGTTGIRNIGLAAFANMDMISSVTLGDTVTATGVWAFSNDTNLTSIILPENFESIGWGAFYGNSNLENIVIGDKVTTIMISAFSGIPKNAKIYCQDITENRCSDLLKDDHGYNGLSNSYALSNLVLFEKEGDLYKIKGENRYFATVDMMANDVSCSKNECQALLSTPAGQQILFHGKFYNSLSDVAAKNYIKKRIYTIDEANQVAGKTNSFKIRYR